MEMVLLVILLMTDKLCGPMNKDNSKRSVSASVDTEWTQTLCGPYYSLRQECINIVYENECSLFREHTSVWLYPLQF